MSELPAGWASTDFDTLFDFKGGSQPPKSEFIDHPAPGYIRLLQIRDFESDAKAIYIENLPKWPKCESSDIMIGRYGASVGKILGGKSGAYNVALVRLIFSRELLVSGWVRSFLRSDHFQIPLTRISRSAQNGFNKEDLANVYVALPPQEEQRRIVAKIDSLSAKSKRARIELDHVCRLTEQFKQAVLSAVFRGALPPKNATLGRNENQAWPEVSLSNVADIGTGSTPKRGEKKYYEGGNIAWITSTAVNEPLVLSASEYITNTAIKETNCKVFPAGTLLMAMYGEGQTRGRVSVLGIDAATNQALAAIQLHSDGPAKEYVLWYLRCNYLELRRKAAGGVQPNLNLGIIKGLRLPLPSRDTQRQIVRRIEHAFTWIDRLAKEATSARKLVDVLDKAVLAKALRGELVPQDPNDEPASALLDRIRAERAEQRSAPAPKRTKKNGLSKEDRPRKARMEKKRSDLDVKGEPYLASLLKKNGVKITVEQLYSDSNLSVVDFYKQLSDEYEKGWLREVGENVEAV
jgi:type I restriction enzyme, S subunit